MTVVEAIWKRKARKTGEAFKRKSISPVLGSKCADSESALQTVLEALVLVTKEETGILIPRLTSLLPSGMSHTRRSTSLLPSVALILDDKWVPRGKLNSCQTMSHTSRPFSSPFLIRNMKKQCFPTFILKLFQCIIVNLH